MALEVFNFMIDEEFDKQYLVICSSNNLILNSFDSFSDCISYINYLSELLNFNPDLLYFRDRRLYVSK